MRSRKVLLKFLVMLTLALGVTTATAAELAGVHLADAINVGKARLQLNGIALRTKYMFKIYVGGLYLAQPSSNAADIVRTDAPKALVMQFMRDIKRETMVEAYQEAFANNAPELLARDKADVDRFLAFLPAVKEGERMVFSYAPGKGSTFVLGGSAPLIIRGKEFADLYLLVFIGPNPPTPEVKQGLLGMGKS
ncbi:MAG: chalcone isomerase family protein [Acidiferrobacterales bacterium]